MFANDKYGDCTCAAAGHMIQDWTANAGARVTPTLKAVIEFYEHFVGKPPPPDEGCNMLDVLKYWRSGPGLGGHKIAAFVAVEPKNHVQAMDAVALLGCLYVGVELPDFAVRGDMLAGAVGRSTPGSCRRRGAKLRQRSLGYPGGRIATTATCTSLLGARSKR